MLCGLFCLVQSGLVQSGYSRWVSSDSKLDVAFGDKQILTEIHHYNSLSATAHLGAASTLKRLWCSHQWCWTVLVLEEELKKNAEKGSIDGWIDKLLTKNDWILQLGRNLLQLDMINMKNIFVPYLFLYKWLRTTHYTGKWQVQNKIIKHFLFWDYEKVWNPFLLDSGISNCLLWFITIWRTKEEKNIVVFTCKHIIFS